MHESLDDIIRDVPSLGGPPKVITVGDKQFHMTGAEWQQVKDWIDAKQQERAMRWWATQFDMPFASAVAVINRVQIAIQFGGLK